PRFTDVPANSEDRAFIEAMISWGDFGPQQPTFQPNETVTWGALNRWLAALKLPTFKTLAHAKVNTYPLTRAECAEYLHRVQKQLGEHLPDSYVIDSNDAMPFDDDNDKVPDRIQPGR
ncbi:MAG: hypothetical protein ABL974_20965, partial [Prosthecobacter sp.]